MHVNWSIKFNNVTRKTHQLKGKPENITTFPERQNCQNCQARNCEISIRSGQDQEV